MTKPFWETKSMHEMTDEEWESLCDGCARCCMYQFEDEDTGRLLQTDVVCGLLDIEACQCTDYANRHERMPGCIRVTPDNILSLDWMPDSCAYRRIALGKALADWHPLITGDPASTREQGHSVKGRVVSANEVDDIESRIISWFEP